MATTRYVWDVLNDNYLSENDGPSTTAVYTNEPTEFGELVSQRRGGVSRYHHLDGQRSTRALTDTHENITDTDIYSAFGEGVASTGSSANPFGFKGALGYHTDSDTGDLYIRARQYWPTIARWLSQDPLGLTNRINLYSYAGAEPVNNVDPTGLKEEGSHTYRLACCFVESFAKCGSSMLPGRAAASASCLGCLAIGPPQSVACLVLCLKTVNSSISAAQALCIISETKACLSDPSRCVVPSLPCAQEPDIPVESWEDFFIRKCKAYCLNLDNWSPECHVACMDECVDNALSPTPDLRWKFEC